MTKKKENRPTLTSQQTTEGIFKTVLQKYNYSLKKGDIVAGTIVSKEKHGLLINIGGDSSAYLPRDEIVKWDDYNLKNKINQAREFCIINVTQNDEIIISIKTLDSIQSWERIKQLHSEDITVLGLVNKQNRGGVLVDVEGITGFVPNSHSKNSQDIKKIIEKNERLPLKFLEIDEKSGYLLLSYKRVVLQMYNSNFNVGKIMKGTITNIKPYGIFVNIGSASGLLHISEISDRHIDNLESIFKIGSEILVSIIHLDTKQGRISLSTKFLK
nr:ribosomal protein S1 [Erythrotrichia welwitschii]